MKQGEALEFRLLIVDDNGAIHEDLKRILAPEDCSSAPDDNELTPLEPAKCAGGFAVDSAFQGETGLARVREALSSSRPYALAFVPLRTPPGWDGIETAAHLWEADGDLQIVLYASPSSPACSWKTIQQRLGVSRNLVVLKKPFDPVEVLSLAHTLTAKWEAARQSRLRLKESERFIEERTAELRRARDAAQGASRAKSEFLANMSHELRTPLNGVIGAAELLQEIESTGEQRELLEMLKLSADSLLAVINGVLDFSKIEAGKLELETVEFNLVDCIQSTLKTLTLRAEEKRLELLCDLAPALPEVVRGDSGRLRQVIVNLVSNAIKFTPQGRVSLRVIPEELSGERGRLHFTVADTGIGIPPEKQKRIFDPFIQADTSTTRKFGGTGLGLAICWRLVGIMGGRIWLESAEQQGTQFHFVIPLPAVESRSVSGADQHGDLPRRALRVLLAEDNVVNQRLASWLLTKRGHSVEAVGDGHAALAALERETYDLVLMDVQMPEMDGMETTAMIRERERQTGKHQTVIALTAHAIKGDEQRCLNAGMDGYLTKPIRPQQLYEVLARHERL